MHNSETQQLKFSDLLAVWKHFGLSLEWQSRCLPAVIVNEHPDAFSRTTQDLIDASIRCELDGDSYMPPPACRWCAGDTSEADKYWTYGHRHDWWVCSHCKREYPCRHTSVDELDEVHLKGSCTTCGLRLPPTIVAHYLHKQYKEKAERLRLIAEACRKRGRLSRD